MDNAIIIDDDQPVSRVLELVLGSAHGLSCQIFSPERALVSLDELAQAKLVIWTWSPTGSMMSFLEKAIGALPTERLLLLVSKNDAESPLIPALPKLVHPFTIRELLSAVDRLLVNPSGQEGPGQESPGQSHFPMTVDCVVALEISEFDLFLRLGEGHFVRVYESGQAGHALDLSRLRKYQSQDVKEVHFRQEDAGELLRLASRRLEKLLNQAEPAPGQEPLVSRYRVNRQAHELIHGFTLTFGLTPEIQDLIQRSVEEAVGSIRRSPVLATLFSSFMAEPERYLSSHSVALAFVACGIASALGWANRMTCLKLTLAAYLHDLVLNDQELAECQTREEVAAMKGSRLSKELSDYLRHPERAAALARRMPDMPLELDMIVLQHHERSDGSGFPHGKTFAAIHPLPSVFIVAHEMVSHQFSRKGESSAVFREFVTRSSHVEWQGSFERIHGALRARLR